VELDSDLLTKIIGELYINARVVDDQMGALVAENNALKVELAECQQRLDDQTMTAEWAKEELDKIKKKGGRKK